MGFDATVARRINFIDLAKRRVTQELEFHWKGSKALSKKAELFGHILDFTYASPQVNFPQILHK